MRSAVEFRVLYETLGLNQQDVCSLLHIKNVESIRRMAAGGIPVSPEQWAVLDNLIRVQNKQVDELLKKAQEVPVVVLPYSYEKRWKARFENSVIRIVADELRAQGKPVEYKRIHND